jgi:hypothetical protein
MPNRKELYEARIAALEQVVRGLASAELDELFAAAQSTPTTGTWPSSDLPFWFQGAGDVRLTEEHEDALGALWTRLLAGTAFAISGEEVETWVDRPGFGARLNRFVQPREERRIEGRATEIIERRIGGRISEGFAGIWNAACAALLTEDLGPALFADLQAVWRAVFHRPLQPVIVTELDPFSAWR